jgi:transcriptional regulator of acetoin/glycerol metabolism/DNA-binding CsgD family transcriptional regulator
MVRRPLRSEPPEARETLGQLDTPWPSAPRQEIGASWDRSARAGLSRERFEVPFVDFDDDGPLVRAARPVLDELMEDLATTGVGVVLTDEQGQLQARRTPDRSLGALFDDIRLAPGSVYAERFVGTNAIGTALEQGGPSMVEGHEHFADTLTSMTCAAHPIIDPRSGSIAGAVDLSCAARNGNSLMMPLARRAARDIERRLFVSVRGAERVLVQRFAQERRRGGGPFVLLNEYQMMANESAKRMLDPDDEPALREFVRLNSSRPAAPGELTLKNVSVNVRSCEPVIEGGEVVGVVVRLSAARPTPTGSSTARGRSERRSGWQSLTDAESEVTGCVCRGMTNREVGESLAMSRYTVDSHLRSIYRKLDVNSRVDLTRVALQHSDG